MSESSETGASNLRSSISNSQQTSFSDSLTSSESSNESNSNGAANTSIDSSSSDISDFQVQTSFPDAEIVYTSTGSIDPFKTRIDFRSPKWESDFDRIRDAISRAPALDEATLTTWSDSSPRLFAPHG